MRFFLRSRQFKIILAIFCTVVIATLSFVIVGNHMSPQTDLASTISTPIKNFFSGISNGISDFFDSFNILAKNFTISTKPYSIVLGGNILQ